MIDNKMNKKKNKFLIIGLIFISISLLSCGQSRLDKTEAIIKKLNLVENQKTNYKFQLEPLKYQATGNDSVKIIEIEKRLKEKEITKRLILAFNEEFSDKEINDIYNFIQTSAFEKVFNSGEIYKIISSQFNDIDKEIKGITENFSKSDEKSKNKFEPIPVTKENGFYATINYNYSNADKEIKLEDKPSLTIKDILEVKKTFSSYNDRPEISIVFTKEGAKKFYLLTKENIGKPIAIVIANYIVSMPLVQMEIIGGKASISGDFSEEEIDKMIEILKGE
jgi:preprotein translocase subunit SecD